uniref:Uncharacterized protein n=1 Tax=Anopheles culicifacies TaxID=139723 RepID=A0A182MKC7_9DIPT
MLGSQSRSLLEAYYVAQDNDTTSSRFITKSYHLDHPLRCKSLYITLSFISLHLLGYFHFCFYLAAGGTCRMNHPNTSYLLYCPFIITCYTFKKPKLLRKHACKASYANSL